MKRSRLTAILIILTLVMPGSTCRAAVYPRVLTLAQAVDCAVSTSYEVRKAKNDTQLKNIELKQAIQAIRDIRKKENTIQFSLLFNIKFPQQHALPKEIDLLMKVPKIQSDLKDLQRKAAQAKLTAVMSCKTAYFNTVELMEGCLLLENRIASAKSTYSRLSRDYLTGNANKSDVEEAESGIGKLEKEYQTSLIRFENAKNKLSEITGVDVTSSYTFSKDFSELQLQRKQLGSVIEHALKNDYKVYKTELAHKISSTNVELLRNIYNNRWGSMVGAIENEIAKNGPIDFETFREKYEAALDNIERPYQGSFKIRILFITISIPKEWLRGELSGIRYFDDRKYALYVALMEREAAAKEEAQARKALSSQIGDEFNGLLELWSAYTGSLNETDRVRLQYERIKKLNLTGDASFTDVESAKNDVLSAESMVLSSLIAYNKSLASFDFTTAGAVSGLLSGVSANEGGQYASGISWVTEESGGSKPVWYLNTLIDEYKFIFGVSIPEGMGIDATHYELCTEDGKLIGSRTSTDKTISHLPLAYQGTTKLIVKLYKQESLIYTSEIDAADYGGVLALQPVTPQAGQEDILRPASGSLIGSWAVIENADKYTSRLVLQMDKKWDMAYYELETDSGSKIGDSKIPIDTPLSHLSIIFYSPEKLILRLYDSEEGSFGDAVIVNDMGSQVVKMK
ncbi:outer membrane protein TolC [Anaerobacterium chartisolvens]|uniref:Outer membrane protein TolC n=1 Tax=Anaerobacterium chartisolvens TaxID=1297424 RepID=A0A369AQT5_9FIRM|nr:TolC family protein [Anaerobacterium chartisolvens]RCX11383.1 outer membrane protein TolC [Anaerobacterium chartisolvens]